MPQDFQGILKGIFLLLESFPVSAASASGGFTREADSAAFHDRMNEAQVVFRDPRLVLTAVGRWRPIHEEELFPIVL